MLLLDAENTAAYLARTGRIPSADCVQVRELPGGVSNQVLYIARTGVPHGDFVLKQAREQLRTAAAWFSRPDRIWREVEVLKICAELVATDARNHTELEASTPRILFEDRDEFAFGMTAAPAGHSTWKQDLLAGYFEPSIAAAVGRLLGRLHARSWHHPQVAVRLDDRSFFDELRLAPYYRTIAAKHPDRQQQIEQLIDSVLAERHALVHADFSPKNLLVSPLGLLLIDFETGHYGDPAFDIGFFGTHLVLKAFHFRGQHDGMLEVAFAFWKAYLAQLESTRTVTELNALTARGCKHLAACLLARVDGKSPVEYITSPQLQALVRHLARQWLLHTPTTWEQLWTEVRAELE